MLNVFTDVSYRSGIASLDHGSPEARLRSPLPDLGLGRRSDQADCETSAGAVVLNHASEACKDTTSPTTSSAGD
jgi:hypothetical protein